MASAAKKITLAPSRDIPFNLLVLSQANVRRVKAGVSIEELAEDIARRGLLQGLSVRAIVDENGVETGMFEIPAGGRRFRALELLVKQKRMTKQTPVPCIVRNAGLPEEDSLAENVQRAPLHPLDQFRAFLALREKGQSEEDIAAAFFVPVSIVKQRLRLASVSPRLLDIYADDGLSLDQLMAFTVSGNHERQEQVYERLLQSYDRQPYAIRRMLTENAVRATDKRALFIGIDAYVEAGGIVMRDLFQSDDGGWLQDVPLLDLMVAEKLRDASLEIQAEGWKWIEVAPSFPYGHSFGLRQLRGEAVSLTDEEAASRAALHAELEQLETDYAEADELPEAIDIRLGEIENAIDALDNRPLRFDLDDIGRAGAFVSIDGSGSLRIERGYVRPEDELPIEPEPDPAADDAGAHSEAAAANDALHANDDSADALEPEEDEGLRPLSDRLLTELTAFRTVALREALGERPDIAYLAALHALTLQAFYPYALDSCLELVRKSVGFSVQSPGLDDSAAAVAIRARHAKWAARLPKEAEDLWGVLSLWDEGERQALFAHVVADSVNAVHELWNRRPRAMAHADALAASLSLDLAAAGWTPSVDNFLGRVTKPRILAAVAEAKGDAAAARIEHLKKAEMAREAEQLLSATGWLPEPLRTPGQNSAAGSDAPGIEQSEMTENVSAMAAEEPIDENHLAADPAQLAAE
jgi:ParB family chromosome partitioning protein